MTNEHEQLSAIEAIAAGRYREAARIAVVLSERQEQHPQHGQCRFCGCTEARGCAIVVVSDHDLVEPAVMRCAWADEESTVCTNVSCLERWRRQAPAEMDVDLHDAAAAASSSSRIVIP